MMYQMPVMAARQYKDRVFRAVFKEKKDLLELYNALRGSDYRDPEGRSLRVPAKEQGGGSGYAVVRI